MTIPTALRLLAVMGLWAACFPLITIGLDLAPHLAFAALRAALAGLCLLLLGANFRGSCSCWAASGWYNARRGSRDRRRGALFTALAAGHNVEVLRTVRDMARLEVY